jgi:hypothetical protein
VADIGGATDWVPLLEGVPLIAQLSQRNLKKIAALTEIQLVLSRSSSSW